MGERQAYALAWIRVKITLFVGRLDHFQRLTDLSASVLASGRARRAPETGRIAPWFVLAGAQQDGEPRSRKTPEAPIVVVACAVTLRSLPLKSSRGQASRPVRPLRTWPRR